MDATHDVFAELVKKRSQLSGDAVAALLYRMATNTCLNVIRTRRRRPETASEELLAQIASMDESESRALASRLLDRVFTREESSTKIIAVLHYVDGMTVPEVAEVVGMPRRRVRERLAALGRRARAFEEKAS